MGATKVFIDKINEALAKGDTAFVTAHVADDVHINFIGGPVLDGKAAVQQALEEVYGHEGTTRTATTVIAQGDVAVVEGQTVSHNSDQKTQAFAFCDVYHINEARDKITQLTSYVVEIESP